MVFVVPDVARYAINGQLEDRAVVNIIDMRIDTTGSTMARSTAVRQQAGEIVGSWVNDILPVLVDDYTFNSVSYVDLDEADGTTGVVTEGGGHTLPGVGGETLTSLPGNAAVLITKNIAGDRSRRNGRMYLAGGHEGWTEPNNGNMLTSVVVTNLNTQFASFLAGISEDDPVGTQYLSRPVVVHILTRGPDLPNGDPGPPLTGDWVEIDSMTVQGRLATQRRRLRG